jgi:eukaryotic-like serine/threonine-protein kinase
MNEETLFHLACEKPPDERAAFLDEACAGDTALRQRLEVLLAAHEQPGSFLQSATQDNGNGEPAPNMGRTVLQTGVQDVAGSVIGPYKLLQQIGEGGMGVVFMAEQSRPVRRTVALKIIKPGMDSRQVIARFEAERQALAMMDHPNIARVLDAGTTDSGRPYFVMELVKGVPITKYCDEHRLTPQDRLELFVHVCHAV